MILPSYNPLVILEKVGKLFGEKNLHLEVKYIPEQNKRRVEFIKNEEITATLTLDDIVFDNGEPYQSFKFLAVGEADAIELIFPYPIIPVGDSIPNNMKFYFKNMPIPTNDEDLNEAGVAIEKLN